MAPLRHLPIWNSKSVIMNGTQPKKIEQYRLGYPRFTALISACDDFFVCRRFCKLRARILLLKQDKLSMLEKKLEEIDRQETRPLFLGKSRCDGNTDRLSLLSDIESCLADYDQFAERTHRMLSLENAHGREVESLQNWLDGNGCLARDETAYLTQQHDLVSLAPAGDSAMRQLESWVEDKLIRFCRAFGKSHPLDVSSDPNVYIHSGPWIQRTAKALLLLLIILLLLTPVVICNIISRLAFRITVVMVFTVFYLLVLSCLTRSRTIELIVAGTTYATVLIVFVSGTNKI